MIIQPACGKIVEVFIFRRGTSLSQSRRLHAAVSAAGRSPDDKRYVRGRQKSKKRGEKNVAEQKTSATRPVLVVVVEEVDENSRPPVHTDEESEAQRRAVAAKQFAMQGEGENSEGHDRQNRKAPVNPHQLAIERRELPQVFLPTQSRGYLKARDQDAEMADAGKPQRETENFSDVVGLRPPWKTLNHGEHLSTAIFGPRTPRKAESLDAQTGDERASMPARRRIPAQTAGLEART